MNNNAMLANKVKVPAFDGLMYLMRKLLIMLITICCGLQFTLPSRVPSGPKSLIIVITRFDIILLDEIGGWLFIYGNCLSHYRSGIPRPWESGAIPALPSFFLNTGDILKQGSPATWLPGIKMPIF